MRNEGRLGKLPHFLTAQKNTALLISFTVLWTWTCGCGGESKKEILAVKQTVLRYCQLLAEGYSKMNMKPLQAVATGEQAFKAYRHMAALGDANTRMESALEDIEFTDVQISDKDEARVKTRERWNYIHQNTDARMSRQTVVEGLIYELAYDLVRRDGKWLVSSVSVLAEDRAGDPAQETTADSRVLNSKLRVQIQ